MTIDTSSQPTDGQRRYAQLHQGSDAAARYHRKLDNRLDRLRHNIERELLSELLAGTVFDCTIGVGRFIGQLPGVTRYDGMDLSKEFVSHVRERNPESHVIVGDLTKGIPCADASYDNVVCMRSLSGIGQLASILPEMLRVVRPGGLVVFDYGRRATVANVQGIRTVLDGEDLDGILTQLNAAVAGRYHVDAVLTRAKIYPRIFRFINGPRGRMISDGMLLRLEQWIAPWLWQRQIVALRRPGSPYTQA